MPEQSDSKQQVLAVVINGLAVVGVGLALTGWLNPILGVVLMSSGFLYWIWELFTAPFLTDRLDRAIRIMCALILVVLLSWFSGPKVYKKLTEKPETPTTDQRAVLAGPPVYGPPVCPRTVQ